MPGGGRQIPSGRRDMAGRRWHTDGWHNGWIRWRRRGHTDGWRRRQGGDNGRIRQRRSTSVTGSQGPQPIGKTTGCGRRVVLGSHNVVVVLFLLLLVGNVVLLVKLERYFRLLRQGLHGNSLCIPPRSQIPSIQGEFLDHFIIVRHDTNTGRVTSILLVIVIIIIILVHGRRHLGVQGHNGLGTHKGRHGIGRPIPQPPRQQTNVLDRPAKAGLNAQIASALPLLETGTLLPNGLLTVGRGHQQGLLINHTQPFQIRYRRPRVSLPLDAAIGIGPWPRDGPERRHRRPRGASPGPNDRPRRLHPPVASPPIASCPPRGRHSPTVHKIAAQGEKQLDTFSFTYIHILRMPHQPFNLFLTGKFHENTKLPPSRPLLIRANNHTAARCLASHDGQSGRIKKVERLDRPIPKMTNHILLGLFAQQQTDQTRRQGVSQRGGRGGQDVGAPLLERFIGPGNGLDTLEGVAGQILQSNRRVGSERGSHHGGVLRWGWVRAQVQSAV